MPLPPPPPPPQVPGSGPSLAAPLASPGRRVAAGAITLAFHVVVVFGPIVLLIAAIVLYDGDRIDTDWIVAAVVAVIVGLALSVLHDIVFVGRYSATIGHRLLGCRLVDHETGQPISYGVAGIRFGVEFGCNVLGVVVLLYFANLISVLVHDEHRHLLDFVANTTLVRESSS